MLKRQVIGAAAMLCALMMCASRCNAWNSTGHELVAQIAFDQLSPGTKAAIITILKSHPRLNEDLLHDDVRAKDDDLAMFLRAATWPDMVRYPAHPMTHTEHHSKWHYVDFPIETDGVKGPAPALQWDGHSDPANLVEAWQKALTELKNPQTAKDRKAIDVCWVEHLAGDIHQPLHATSWFSKEFPQGDQGGNLDVIQLENKEIVNLHYYWDSIEGMSLDPEQIRKIADRIESEHPVATLKDRAADLSVVDWARESLAIAKSVVYLNGTLPHATRVPGGAPLPTTAPELPAGYAEKALATADERIALAGYRLAAVLDQIAKEN
jgi:hypothetical protein